MLVIKKLGDRVEKEHDQFLRDSQRLEDRSATAVNDGSGPKGFATSVDFESLVGRSNGAIKADTTIDANKSWDDDVWGSIFNEEVSKALQLLKQPGTHFFPPELKGPIATDSHTPCTFVATPFTFSCPLTTEDQSYTTPAIPVYHTNHCIIILDFSSEWQFTPTTTQDGTDLFKPSLLFPHTNTPKSKL